jgi:hypothetical protein
MGILDSFTSQLAKDPAMKGALDQLNLLFARLQHIEAHLCQEAACDRMPANKVWIGTVQLAHSHHRAISNAGTTGGLRADWTPGTGGTPAYTVARTEIAVHETSATASTGASDSQAVTVYHIILYAGTTNGILELLLTGSASNIFGTASGWLVDA